MVEMDLDDNNCSGTYATLRIVGVSVAPQLLTNATGIFPSFSVHVGDVWPKGTLPRNEGIWSVDSKNMCKSNDLEDHIVQILSRLPDDFQKYVPDDARLEMHCVWRSSTGHGGPVLSVEILARLADFGLGLDFDFYSDV